MPPTPAVLSGVKDLHNPGALAAGWARPRTALPSGGDDCWIQFDNPLSVKVTTITWTHRKKLSVIPVWVTLEARDRSGTWRKITEMDVGVMPTPVHLTTTASSWAFETREWRVRWRSGAGQERV